MGSRAVLVSAAATWGTWGQSRKPRPISLTNSEQDTRQPLLQLQIPPKNSSPSSRHYGVLDVPQLTDSPERMRADSFLGSVPEEDPEDSSSLIEGEEDLELELEGLYRGSYKRIVALYTLVPLTSFLVLVMLAFIPPLFLPIPAPHLPQPKYFSTPVSELLLSFSLWSFSHHLRLPIYSLFSIFPYQVLVTVLSTATHIFLHNFLRLSSFPILNVQLDIQQSIPTWRDWAFRRVWCVALGWCVVETIVGVAQGYEQIALYRSALVPEEEVHDILHANGPTEATNGKRPSSAGGASDDTHPRGVTGEDVAGNSATAEAPPREYFGHLADTAIALQIDRELDYLTALQERERLEALYGIPFIKIPVFVSCLQRVSSIILSFGITLLLSSAYLCAPLSRPQLNLLFVDLSNGGFFWTFAVIFALHTALAVLHTPLILPRIGVHTAAYLSLLVGLGCLFAGLGMWDALS